MKRPIVLVGALLIAFAFGACGVDGSSDITYFYDGVVLDSVSKAPLDSVEVVVGDTLLPAVQRFTDSVDRYSFALFGRFRQLTFRRQGYTTKTLSTNFNGFRDSMEVLLAK